MAYEGCDDWHAIHDRMPPGPATLRVTATCRCEPGGRKRELRPHEPQGINPKDLLLDLVEGYEECEGEYELEFREDTDTEYETVSILPDGPSGIEVETIS